MSKYIWEPTEDLIQKANATAFMKMHDIETAEELIEKSMTGSVWFWDQCLHVTGIEFFEPYLNLFDPSDGIAHTSWFSGGTTNLTHNCIDKYAKQKKFQNKVAYIWEGECGSTKSTTYLELLQETNRVANYMISQGIKVGDRVALYLPMIKELIPIFFAIQKIGAVVVPIFTGFGTDAIQIRLKKANVKMVFTSDGTLRKGKELYPKNELDAALLQTENVETVVVVKRLHTDKIQMQKGRDVFYEDAILEQSENLEPFELDSEAPCMIIFTSGTTGEPKGTIHTHIGVMAQVAKEHHFHFDLKSEDRWLWVTDIGWMMGPWYIIGSLLKGASAVLLEGNPIYPNVDRIIKSSAKFEVTHLGVSPTLTRLLMKEELQKKCKTKIKSLKFIGSSGEAWDDVSYKWCFKTLGQNKTPIINISGGTELMGCLLAPLPIKPLKVGSLQGPALGMAVDIFSEDGYSCKPNEVGYLVCKKPAPSMTKGFLNDNQRYEETYFSKFKNVWNHGDWAMKDEDGDWFLKGRADDTIKVSGKRIGPAEIESVLCDHNLVVESCAIGIPHDLKGEQIISFVVLKTGIAKTKALQADILALAEQKLGKSLLPSEIHVVANLPKTRSGKIVRATIKKKYLGETQIDVSSLENSDHLEDIPSYK